MKFGGVFLTSERPDAAHGETELMYNTTKIRASSPEVAVDSGSLMMSTSIFHWVVSERVPVSIRSDSDVNAENQIYSVACHAQAVRPSHSLYG